MSDPFSELAKIPGLQTYWTFKPTTPDWGLIWRRALFPLTAHRRPAQHLVRGPSKRRRWVVYFAFCPRDRCEAHHRFTLERLKDTGLPVFVICTSTSPAHIPEEIAAHADALCWKASAGYDFSAYTLGLEYISKLSPGATTLVLNDSVFGPFEDLNPLIETAPWQLTGFTATGLGENHIQSYAFLFQEMTPKILADLRSVFFAGRAYSGSQAVIWCQEAKLARVASRHMTVGSYVYCDGTQLRDASLQTPFELLDAGFPFLKRSLLGKMSRFQIPQRLIHFLEAEEHGLDTRFRT